MPIRKVDTLIGNVVELRDYFKNVLKVHPTRTYSPTGEELESGYNTVLSDETSDIKGCPNIYSELDRIDRDTSIDEYPVKTTVFYLHVETDQNQVVEGLPQFQISLEGQRIEVEKKKYYIPVVYSAYDPIKFQPTGHVILDVGSMEYKEINSDKDISSTSICIVFDTKEDAEEFKKNNIKYEGNGPTILPTYITESESNEIVEPIDGWKEKIKSNPIYQEHIKNLKK